MERILENFVEFLANEVLGMQAAERRAEILEVLRGAKGAVSATQLAARFGVSRQVIVGDVALLRAGGADICATPRGYTCRRAAAALIGRVACRHDGAQMSAELYAIVDAGCTVVDVIVEHPIYGQLTGPLQLASRADVDAFLARCAGSDAQPLSALTEGIHLHTLACPSPEAYAAAQRALADLGVLFTGQENRR